MFINPVPKNYLTVYFFSILLQKKIVFDFYYSASLDMYTIGVYSKLRLKIKRKLENLVVVYSYKLFFITPAERALYLTYHNQLLNTNRHFVFPVIKTNLNLTPKLPYFNKALDYLTISWWGNPSYIHNLDILFRSLFEIHESLNYKLLIFVPNLSAKERVLSMIYKYDNLINSTDIYLGYNFDDIETYKLISENADLSISHFGTTPQGLNTITNKLIDSLNLGIPSLSINTRAYVDFEIINGKTFIEASPEVESIKESIINYSKKSCEEVEMISEQSREIFNKYFSETTAHKYLFDIFALKKNDN